MLAGKGKITAAEKNRRDQVLKGLKPGVVLEFIISDYHEDDETPHGFMCAGDVVKLIRVAGSEPVVDSKTNKIVYHLDVWEIETHYGLMKKDANYLAYMTKVKNEAEN